MHAALRSARWPRVVLAVYLGCLALVCSFILFEVLDVDGSDFVQLPTSIEARPVESHHDALKRVVLAVVTLVTGIGAALAGAQALHRLVRIERAAPPRAARFVPSPATRLLLPRVALADGVSA